MIWNLNKIRYKRWGTYGLIGNLDGTWNKALWIKRLKDNKDYIE